MNAPIPARASASEALIDRRQRTHSSPVRIIEARRAPQRPPEAAGDRPFWAITCLVCLIAVAVAFVAADGIVRAFARPEACLTLSAHECAAKLQERAAE